MKLQHLGVIFIIIILPVIIVTSMYIQTQIDTVVLQTSYDSKLMDATHDAIKAFQINEINNNSNNNPQEKLRDVKASVKSFYSSLATGMGATGYTEEDLSPYIPALVYTLYDGYYMYLPFYNKKQDGSIELERNLKPFIYYSARYKNGSIDVVINYTLDNYITVYGTVNGNTVEKSGYFINPNRVQGTADSTITYNDTQNVITIEMESLSEVDKYQYIENASRGSAGGDVAERTYKYVSIANPTALRPYTRQKAYQDSRGWYYYDINQMKIYIDSSKIDNTRNDSDLSTNTDISAKKYFEQAKEFSTWIKDELGSITVDDIILDADVTINNQKKQEIFGTNRSDKIFAINSGDLNRNPEDRNDIFTNHKREVIKNSIQTNLYAAIIAYNSNAGALGSTYNFKMPELKETDWDKILNNVSMISFMQGLPIKNKFYNGYSIVTNTKNKEFVDPKSIYYIQGNTYYNYNHSGLNGNLLGYRNLDFEVRQVYDETRENEKGYYFPHAQAACYDCIISSSSSGITNIEQTNESVRKAYYTALARERYNSFKSIDYGG